MIMTPSRRTRNGPAGPRKGLLRRLLPGLCACPRLAARAAGQHPCMATAFLPTCGLSHITLASCRVGMVYGSSGFHKYPGSCTRLSACIHVGLDQSNNLGHDRP